MGDPEFIIINQNVCRARNGAVIHHQKKKEIKFTTLQSPYFYHLKFYL